MFRFAAEQKSFSASSSLFRIKGANFLWDDLYIKAGSSHDFRTQVEIFNLHFLSSLWSKKENFSAHHKENFLTPLTFKHWVMLKGAIANQRFIFG